MERTKGNFSIHHNSELQSLSPPNIGDNQDPAENEVEEEEADNGVDGLVETDLLDGSKKRSKSSKKMKRAFICEADQEFMQLHGPGDFSSLPYNDLLINNRLIKYRRVIRKENDVDIIM